MKPTLNQIIIAALIVLLVRAEACNCINKGKLEKCKAQPQKGTVTKTDTVVKTIKEAVNVPVYIPQPYNVYKTVTVPYETILRDTVKVFEDYVAKVYYKDSFNTKYGKYQISDTLQFNRIAGRSIQGSETIPQLTVTKTITTPKRNQVWLGLNATYLTTDSTLFPSVSLDFLHKRGIGYKAEVGYKNGLTFGAGIKYKLSFKR